MAKSAPETIILKGTPNIREAQANAALSPGHVVELLSTGKIQKQSTADENTMLMVAMENDLIGKTIADAYAADDNVYVHMPKPGDMIYVRVPAAAAAIVIGDHLELVGDGTVHKLAAGAPLAIAEEAVDNSGGGTEVFIKATVI